ncbi:hypothetical protein ACFYXC_11180 [Streptomyces sp. NPDC002701]|uniref:hypothetical protein n=1 Tax=Streptomyces sp. NPDC002701 TaxID=3364661 RepID=UPI0036CB6725
MNIGISRPLVAVSVAAVLGCTAACGSGSTGQDGKPSRPAAAERTAGQRTADGERKARRPAPRSPGADGTSAAPDGRGTPGTPDARKAAGPLSEAQLKKAALVTEDVKGYEVKESDGAELLGQSVPATPSACQPIADMFLFTTDPVPKAGVSRGVGSKDDLDASVTTLTLLSYEPGGSGGSDAADEVIKSLRSAAKNCTAYRHADYDYRDVKALAAPDLGDASVAFRLVASIEGAEVPAAYTVVRDGTTLVAFSSMNMLDADKAEVPVKLVKAQLAKLARTAG